MDRQNAKTYTVPRAYMQPRASFLVRESSMSRITGIGSRRITPWRITSATEEPKYSILRLPQWPCTSDSQIFFGGVQKNAVANVLAIHRAVHRPMVV